MAGLIIKQEYFRFHPKSSIPVADSEDAGYADTKRIIDNVAFSWIGPVFFVELGTKITFDMDVLVGVIPHIITLTLGILFAQIISASLAARYTGNFKWHESIMIGFGMLGRASGFCDYGYWICAEQRNHHGCVLYAHGNGILPECLSASPH